MSQVVHERGQVSHHFCVYEALAKMKTILNSQKIHTLTITIVEAVFFVQRSSRYTLTLSRL